MSKEWRFSGVICKSLQRVGCYLKEKMLGVACNYAQLSSATYAVYEIFAQ